MGKGKADCTPQNEAGRELTAIKRLLEVDLNDVTRKQRDDAETTLRSHPSNWQLIGIVRQWAQALAGVCRKHARDCARVHESRNDQDPATSAMGTILLALSDHLRLPADGVLLFENWPAESALRGFVLEVCGAPIELIDGELVRQPTLPRWEPKSSFARKIVGLEPDPPRQNGEFLSIAETEAHFRGLEEEFCNALSNDLNASFSEAILATEKKRVLITLPVEPQNDGSKVGHSELGATIYALNQDLQRLAQIGCGRRYTEDELRAKRPELQIWDAIERSESLSPRHMREFFETALSAYRVEERFTFIGQILGDKSWSQTYDLYKGYRDSAGLAQRRRKTLYSTKPKQP